MLQKLQFTNFNQLKYGIACFYFFLPKLLYLHSCQKIHTHTSNYIDGLVQCKLLKILCSIPLTVKMSHQQISIVCHFLQHRSESINFFLLPGSGFEGRAMANQQQQQLPEGTQKQQQKKQNNSDKTENIYRTKQIFFFLFFYLKSKMYCSHSLNNQHVNITNTELKLKSISPRFNNINSFFVRGHYDVLIHKMSSMIFF